MELDECIDSLDQAILRKNAIIELWRLLQDVADSGKPRGSKIYTAVCPICGTDLGTIRKMIEHCETMSMDEVKELITYSLMIEQRPSSFIEQQAQSFLATLAQSIMDGYSGEMPWQDHPKAWKKR